MRNPRSNLCVLILRVSTAGEAWERALREPAARRAGAHRAMCAAAVEGLPLVQQYLAWAPWCVGFAWVCVWGGGAGGERRVESECEKD